MLLALLDGRALPMSLLASEAGVSASTASAHLSRLVSGGLLRVRQEGRHRYYDLAGPQVGTALEALSLLAPARPVRSLRAGTRAQALRLARTCYDHLAGHLGVAVMSSLIAQGALRGGDGIHHSEHTERDRLAAPGHDYDYQLTDQGHELFDRLKVTIPQGRRQLIRYCVDWTEQRHHLSGAVGAALLARFEQLNWVTRGAKSAQRALKITDEGKRGLVEYFDVDISLADVIAGA